jgi:hypothetical protein
MERWLAVLNMLMNFGFIKYGKFLTLFVHFWSNVERKLSNGTYKRKPSMPPVSFEPTIPASERVQTYALDSMATGIGSTFIWQQTLDFSLWSGGQELRT